MSSPCLCELSLSAAIWDQVRTKLPSKMSKWEAKPFAVRHTLVIEGGWLQSPWAVNSKMIDGRDFITLVLGDRCLARALGMNMSERSPLAKCSIFSYMAEARDAKVDELIFAAKVSKDPMAEASASDQAAASRMPSRGRAVAFEEAEVPDTISIKMGAVVTPDGQRVEEHTLRVVTTPKRGASVTMEVTAENFEWLRMAAQVDWDIVARPEKRSIDELDDTTLPERQPPLKYQKTPTGKLNIICNYFQDGAWKKHQKVLGVNINSDNSSLEAIVRSCESDVLAFYSSHHERTSHEDEKRPSASMT